MEVDISCVRAVGGAGSVFLVCAIFFVFFLRAYCVLICGND